MQYNAIAIPCHCNAMRLQCNAMRCIATQSNEMQRSAMQSNSAQVAATDGGEGGDGRRRQSVTSQPQAGWGGAGA
eukprot:3421272-Pyramimonas_sp.AAC.1